MQSIWTARNKKICVRISASWIKDQATVRPTKDLKSWSISKVSKTKIQLQMLVQLEILVTLATFQRKTQNLITEDARRTLYLHKTIWKRGIRFRPSNQFLRHKMLRLQWVHTKTDNSQTRCQQVWSMVFKIKDTNALILVPILQERRL